MLDRDLYVPIMQDLPKEKQLLARMLLNIDTDPVMELKVDWHPSGRYTLKRRPSGQNLYQDCVEDPKLFGNTGDGEFYRAVCGEIRKHLEAGSRVAFRDCHG